MTIYSLARRYLGRQPAACQPTECRPSRSDRAAPRRRRAGRTPSTAAAAILLAAGAAGMLIGIGTGTAAAATPVIDPNSNTAVYTLQNVSSGLVADDLNSSSAAGSTIGQWPSNGGTNQQWTIVSSTGADSGYYTIENDSSGLCLDVSGASTAEGAPVIQWTCTGDDNQQWAINFTAAASGGSQPAQIVNKNSGQYLVVNSTGAGTGLVQSSLQAYFDSSETRDWNLVRSTGGTPFVIAQASSGNPTNDGLEPSDWPSSDYVLDVPDFSTAWGTLADLWQANGGDNQRWYLQQAATLDGDPQYRIMSVYGSDWADALCLEAEGANPEAGADVDLDGCDPNSINQPNQLWMVAGGQRWGSLDDLEAAADIWLVNVAMLYDNDPYDAPVLTESSSIYPTDGATMTMEFPNWSIEATQNEWNLTPITTGTPTGASGTPCSMFACLTNV
jgi:hypothetical protein